MRQDDACKILKLALFAAPKNALETPSAKLFYKLKKKWSNGTDSKDGGLVSKKATFGMTPFSPVA